MSDDTLAQAERLFEAFGVSPDDIARLVRLGTSPDGRLRILLPEECNPALIAALLGLVASTTLDVGDQARAAEATADALIRKMREH